MKGLPQTGDKLTRAEFTVMLVQAAELPAPTGPVTLPLDVPANAWYAEILKTALAKGVVKGTAGNTFSPNQPITQAQAVVLVSRVLGLPGVPAPGQLTTPVPNNHWAFVPFTWLVKDGIVDASVPPDIVLTPVAGATLLEKVFGSAREAKDIAAKSKSAQAGIKTTRVTGTMSMSMQPNPAVQVQGMPTNMNMQAKVAMEMNLDQGFHQQFTMTILGLPQPMPSMEIEQYMVAEGMYMKIKDPITGEQKWFKMPEGTMPNFVELMKQQSTLMQLPKELEDLFRYRLLGEKTIGSNTFYELAFYGNIPDLAQFMNLVGAQAGLSPELKKSFEQTSSLISGISMSGKMLVNKDNYLTDSLNGSAVVTFADQFQGQAFPLKSIAAQLNFNYKDYNANIEIKLPEAAAKAEVIPSAQTGTPLSK